MGDAGTRAVARALAANVVITALKFGSYAATSSSSMLAEAVHTLVDCGNQILLLVGTRQATRAPDTKHPYGYGRAAFFWSLMSAMSVFFVGSVTTIGHGVYVLAYPAVGELHMTWHTWAVLAASFTIDGAVLRTTLRELAALRKPGQGTLEHLVRIRDPFVMAVVLEDVAATAGVVVAVAGIAATTVTGNVMWDGLASVAVGGLLGAVAFILARTNYKYLLGLSVDPATTARITLLLERPAIEAVYGVTCEWVAPAAFAYRAEIDFDGAYFASCLASYHDEIDAATRDELPAIMRRYAEDVTRLVEQEVVAIERAIRSEHPEAAFIELEPRRSSTKMAEAVGELPTTAPGAVK